MKNNNGFTLIELLAVIVVLGIVMVIGTTTVLPLMDQSREQAFRTEATGIIKSAENVKDLISLGQLKVSEIANSCSSTTKMCFPVDGLIDTGYHKGNKDNYDGVVVFTNTNGSYTFSSLNLKKGTEHAIIGGTKKDYTNGDVELSNVSSWNNSYNTCSCS